MYFILAVRKKDEPLFEVIIIGTGRRYCCGYRVRSCVSLCFFGASVFLAENGFSIKCERYALEKRRPYRIIYAVYSGKKRRISKEESLFGLVPVLRQDESAYRFFCIKQAEKLRKKAAGIEIQNMDCSDVIKLEEHARKLADSPLFWDRICFTSAAAKPVKNMQT